MPHGPALKNLYYSSVLVPDALKANDAAIRWMSNDAAIRWMSEESVQEFYLSAKVQSKNDNCIILGDYNGRVGNSVDGYERARGGKDGKSEIKMEKTSEDWRLLTAMQIAYRLETQQSKSLLSLMVILS